jgi:hypothetical protein
VWRSCGESRAGSADGDQPRDDDRPGRVQVREPRVHARGSILALDQQPDVWLDGWVSVTEPVRIASTRGLLVGDVELAAGLVEVHEVVAMPQFRSSASSKRAYPPTGSMSWLPPSLNPPAPPVSQNWALRTGHRQDRCCRRAQRERFHCQVSV